MIDSYENNTAGGELLPPRNENPIWNTDEVRETDYRLFEKELDDYAAWIAGNAVWSSIYPIKLAHIGGITDKVYESLRKLYPNLPEEELRAKASREVFTQWTQNSKKGNWETRRNSKNKTNARANSTSDGREGSER